MVPAPPMALLPARRLDERFSVALGAWLMMAPPRPNPPPPPPWTRLFVNVLPLMVSTAG